MVRGVCISRTGSEHIMLQEADKWSQTSYRGRCLGQAMAWIKQLFGDATYDRRTLLDNAGYLDFTAEVVRGLQGQDGFQVRPFAHHSRF